MMTTDEAEAARRAIAAIWERAHQPMLDRVATLENAVADLLAGDLAEESQREAERSAHRIAGTAGTFGFGDASQAARTLEQLFASDNPAERMQEAAELVVALRDSIETPGSQEAPSPSEVEEPPVLVAITDKTARNAIVDGLASGGLRAASLGGASERPDASVASALIVETRHERHITLIRAFARHDETKPIVALVNTASFTGRLEASRAGAHLVLADTTPTHRVVEATIGLIDAGRRRDAPPTILVTDDDPLVHEAFTAIGKAVRWRVVHCEDARDFWDVHTGCAPDLIVLDVDMPEVDGVEVCRALRSDPAHAAVPVVFLTARTDRTTIQRVFAAGADDFVTKPFAGPDVVSRITGRLERAKIVRQSSEIDPLTNLPTRIGYEIELRDSLERAQRYDAPLVFALVRIERLAEMNAREGFSATDNLLRSLAGALRAELSGDDLLARLAGAEFVIVLPGLTREDGADRLGELLETARRSIASSAGVRLVGGIAEHPRDGADHNTLYSAAHGALRQAREQAGDAVATAGSPADSTIHDIVVVDDDEILAELLEHALGIRGYRTTWICDGEEALARLAGTEPQTRGRVVLLDVDLPGASGLDILRQLRADSVLDETRVIMLTARTSDVEVIQALELGAFDHVAKPFSTAILVQRVRRALED